MSIITKNPETEPMFRVIEGRFHTEIELAREILQTQIAWEAQEQATNRWPEYGRLEDLLGQFHHVHNNPEAVTEYLAETVYYTDYVTNDGEGLQGDWLVGSWMVCMGGAEQKQFIWGYMEAAVFAGSPLCHLEGKVVEHGDGAPGAVRDILGGTFDPNALPTEAFEALEAEATGVLEDGLLVDMEAMAAIWQEVYRGGGSGGGSGGGYTWKDAGADALFTREGHGTGFWERGDGMEGATRWAEGLGTVGHWEYDMGRDELTYTSNDH